MHCFFNTDCQRQMRYLLLMGFLIFSQVNVHAQNEREKELRSAIDSLANALYTFNYFDSLNNEPLFFTFPYKAIELRDQALAENLDEIYYYAESTRARFYSYNDVVFKVHDIYDSAILYARRKNDLLNQARFAYYKGHEYYRNDEYDVALSYYDQALTISDSMEYKRVNVAVINAMAATYAQIDRNESSLKYYHMANRMALEMQDSSRINATWGNVGLAHARLGQGDSALYFANKAYDLALSIKDVVGIRRALNVRIMGSQLVGKHDDVFKLTNEMLEIIRPVGEIGSMVTPWLYRSKSYWATGKPDKALSDIDSSLNAARKVGYVKGQSDALAWRAELLEKMGRTKEALVSANRLRFFKDSIYRDQIEKRLISITENYEIRARQNRSEGLQKVNAANTRRLFYRNLAIVALVMVFLVMIILILLVNRRKLEKEKYALQETQDKLLRSQMNPHFLFNALSSIQLFLINKGQGKEALEYLSKFAKLMRRILENSRESMVPLEVEMATLRHYLDLQKIRFDNKFDYSISVETENDVADIMIPPMFAQPFIENSLEHGIADRDDGMIKIWFKESAEGLSFRVEDNGVGVSRSTRTDKEASHKSLATIITRDRINILRRQLKKHISFVIRDKVNEREEITGTEVVFELPVVYR